MRLVAEGPRVDNGSPLDAHDCAPRAVPSVLMLATSIECYARCRNFRSSVCLLKRPPFSQHSEKSRATCEVDHRVLIALPSYPNH